MAVRLKFKVMKRIEYATTIYQDRTAVPARLGSLELIPVTGGSDENAQFYAMTPSGKIEFSSVNSAALDNLPLGTEVYVTIEPVTTV